MTTLDETDTLADLYEALRHARTDEKRALLRCNAAALPSIRAYIAKLTAKVDALRDAEAPETAHVDNSFDMADLNYGFHIVPGGRRPNR